MITSLTQAAVMHAGYGGWGWGFGFLFLLVPLLVFGLFVLTIGIAGRRWRRAAWAQGGGRGYYGHGGWGHGGGNSAAQSAESTLADRFARGDIDEKEYRARLDVLRAASTPPEPPR